MKKQLLTSLFAFLLVFSLCMGCSKAETGDKTTASDSFEVSSQKTSPVKITLVFYNFTSCNSIFYIGTTDISFLHSLQTMLCPENL